MAKEKVKLKSDVSVIRSLLVFVALFMLILIGTVFNDWTTIKENVKETEEINAKYQTLLEEEASLNSEVIKLQDPEYVARYAREKYMYTKNGEKILKIVDGKVLPSSDESVENEIEVPVVDENIGEE